MRQTSGVLPQQQDAGLGLKVSLHKARGEEVSKLEGLLKGADLLEINLGNQGPPPLPVRAGPAEEGRQGGARAAPSVFNPRIHRSSATFQAPHALRSPTKPSPRRGRCISFPLPPCIRYPEQRARADSPPSGRPPQSSACLQRWASWRCAG